ncbi:DUF3611 family protein [Geitlerinema sp. PCC 9228]|jgi:hypothetical protein|uniref:DUF3611 family protein n=1 Tax=Geitlerinema sp. PCC 9228 TaxID=111611 RepID=UPI0008F9D5D2|nr:DUF3611 family protein [Geitlerinema sp. PCC 9228]
MPKKTDDPALPNNLPPTIQRVIPWFQKVGWIGFWAQVVLGVVAAVIFLFVLLFGSSEGNGNTQGSNGTLPGLFLAVVGLLFLGLSIFWSFRYTRLARQLATADSSSRPTKADTIQLLRRGLYVNLIGMGVSLMGAESITGILFFKSLRSQTAGFINPRRINDLIEPLDIYVVLANTHTIVAHFIGLVAALLLLSVITRE